jgi:hypothetical protein
MSSRKALLAVVFVLAIASMACDPMSFLATKTPTDTPTPTVTDTPTNTPTFTPTNTSIASPTNTKNPNFVDTSGDVPFSYKPPRGWDQIDSKYSDAAWAGPNGEFLDFSLNADQGHSVSDWAESLVGYLQENISGLQVLAADAFSPDSNIDAAKVVIEYENNGYQIHEELYFFGAEGYILLGDYSREQSTGPDQDDAVDACMMTVDMGGS